MNKEENASGLVSFKEWSSRIQGGSGSCLALHLTSEADFQNSFISLLATSWSTFWQMVSLNIMHPSVSRIGGICLYLSYRMNS